MFSTISGGKISWIIEYFIFFDLADVLCMCPKEEKEVTELLFCQQIMKSRGAHYVMDFAGGFSKA